MVKNLKKELLKQLPKIKWISVGTCPNCGKELIRDEDVTHAVCACSSVVVELSPAVILPDKLDAYFQNLSTTYNLPFEDVLALCYQVGFVNLKKALKKRELVLQVMRNKLAEVKNL
jgi:hypothetical protein